MNYLAHAYLSFGNPPILLGNMISDFVKGKQKFQYDASIQNGIMLHRQIDTFTDTHKATREARHCFTEVVGLYAGPFLDIVYDHFLALDTTLHTPEQLKEFAANTYAQLSVYGEMMPEKFARMFPYMQMQDWLYNYRTLTGIQNSFGGLARRAVYLNNSIAVYEAFLKHYHTLQQAYEQFFPDVKAFAKTQLDSLVSQQHYLG